MSAFWQWLRATAQKIIKGILLLVWIYALSLTTMYAATSSISRLMFNMFDESKYFYSIEEFEKEKVVSPTAELRKYINQRYNENPPPIESVIDSLLSNPGWTDRQLKIPANVDDKNTWLREQYRHLFTRIDQRLNAIVSDKSSDPNNIKFAFSDIIPDVFTDTSEERKHDISLTKEAINWIISYREYISSKKTRGSLIDTFVMLMALGAFGSLIFLTRDYILSPETVRVESYIFRPVLGMFLAVAIFIVDIAAHTIVSSSDILSIRHETLYLLALAAGLLSEQAYSMVGNSAKNALADIEIEKQSKENADAKTTP